MRTKTFTSLSLLLLFSVISAPITRPQTNEKSKKSHESFVSDKNTKDEWSQKEPPRNGEEWFARGYQMHSSDRYPEAIEAFKHAIDLGYRKATAMYNIACGYSLLNDKENAFVWLQRSLDNGFDGASFLADDSDLDPLRTDARFKKIMAAVPSDDDQENRRNAKRYGKPDRLVQTNIDFARLEGDAAPNGEEWATVGMNLLMLRELDRSVIALKRAVTALDYQASSAMYNLACVYSLQGNRDAGIEWLEKSVKAGFDGPEKLRNDPDIKNLRTDPRFPAIEKLSNTLSLSQFNETEFNDERDGRPRHRTNYSKERWAPAIVLYESFLKSEPNSGRAWFNLGYALHYSDEHTRAIGAFEHALTLGYHKPVAAYNIACAYAMLNQVDPAFDWLDRAFKAGFDSHGLLHGDRDLDNLRSDPRFARFMETAAHNEKMRHQD